MIVVERAARRVALVGSGGARTRAGHRASGPRSNPRERGLALILTLTAVAILAVMLADMHENTGTAFAIATNQRSALQSEYLARSGLNLTRMLVRQEPALRVLVAPFYQMLLGRPPPQIPVWKLANELLQPFCKYDQAQETAGGIGIDLGAAKGLGDLPGECEIIAFAENSKINVNDPLLIAGPAARKQLALQTFALLGGYQAPSVYDPLFERRDADGNFTSRLDVVSALIDWWDTDTERTTFDPGAAEVTSGGAEDDVYASFPSPYRVKNAPFDSLEELRLVRGVGDDFWATFVEPDPDNPDSRVLTIYGSGLINPNEAPPAVLLARLCAYAADQPLCNDPLEAVKFIQLFDTARNMFPVPFFSGRNDFMNFVEGKGGERDLYPTLQALLGPDHPLLFRPISLPAAKRGEIAAHFVTSAQILSIHSTGYVCRGEDCTTTTIKAVVNFHDRWTPPPPNAGTMPGLGVVQYFRME